MNNLVKNKTPKADWKPGDTAYYETPYAYTEGIRIGTVLNVNGLYVDIQDNDASGRLTLCHENLFDSQQAAMDALVAKTQEKIVAYKAQIPDVEALVRFGYENTVATCEEYTDWEARAAYRERAKELLDINLTV